MSKWQPLALAKWNVGKFDNTPGGLLGRWETSFKHSICRPEWALKPTEPTPPPRPVFTNVRGHQANRRLLEQFE